MKIVMLSCNTGEGHNSTAKAIQEVLSKRGVSCDLVDVLSYLSPKFSKFVCNWHARLYKYAPKLWDVGYRALENKDPRNEDESAMLYELLSLGAAKLRKMLDHGKYDAVICTHVFSGMMMTELRRVWNVDLPCYFIATDYAPHPYLDCCDLDGYFIPSAAQTVEFLSIGLPREKLIVSGIPVRQEFYQKLEKAEARKQLDLPEDALVTLLMCGSMGCGPMRKLANEVLDRLPKNSILVAFCGRNKKLYETLSGLDAPGLRVMGFTNQVGVYMDAADILVTKPGGLSSTEAANKRLPAVFINAVGGCESRNYDYFLNRGYAVGSSDPAKVLEMTSALAADPAGREIMSELMARDFTKNSAVFIADTVMEAGRQYRKGAMVSESLFGMDSEKSGYPLDEKGGYPMDHIKQETLTNLAKSFAGESQARTRYTVYANVARTEGNEWIARIFEETAANEAVHAQEFLEMLQKLGGSRDNIEITAGYPFVLGATGDNLAAAADGELQEHDLAYPEFAEIARREGYDDAARLWLQIARIEGVHHNTFQSLHQQLTEGSLTEKDRPIIWRCLNCGYTYEGVRACDPCPVCEKGAGWQQGETEMKKMIPKKS